MNQAAQHRCPLGRALADARHERLDFAEFLSLALTAAAANVGGLEATLGGRPASWEADHFRNLLVPTVGREQEDLWQHRTEPLVVRVDGERILTEFGSCAAYGAPEHEREGLEDAVPDVYNVYDGDGCWTPSDAVRSRCPPDVVASRGPHYRGGDRFHREPTQGRYDLLDGLDDLREQREHQRRPEWAGYGQAFMASLLPNLDREPILGLRVAVDAQVDLDGSSPTDRTDDLSSPVDRQLDAGRPNTPLPGSRQAPKDYRRGADSTKLGLAEAGSRIDASAATSE